MPSSVRPKGSGSASRPSPVTPMSERQQMALLMQMTSNSNEGRSRSPSSNLSRARDRNERGETPLHLAAIKGDIEQVSKLLAHHADPNVADFAGWTPLHEACSHGWYEVAIRLIQSGANINARGLDNETPLHDAASNGHVKVAKLLLERGADIHVKNSKGKTPVEVALPTVKPYLLNPSLSLPEPPSTSRGLQSRARDDKKISNHSDSVGNKVHKDDPMDSKSSSTVLDSDDVYEFKSLKDTTGESPDRKTATDSDADADKKNTDSATVSNTDPLSISSQTSPSEEGCNTTTSKRSFAESNESSEELNTGSVGSAPTGDDEFRRKKRKDESSKEGKSAAQRNTNQLKGQNNKQLGGNQSKSGTSASSKSGSDKKSPCSSPKPTVPEQESEEGKSDLKVPPLKIVIPQTSNSEQESGPGRNGKGSSQRTHLALPYIVATSNSSETGEKEQSSSSSAATETTPNVKIDEKREPSGANHNETQQTADSESCTTSSSSTATSNTSAPVELHPRKRKMKQNKEQPVVQPETLDAPAESQVHPHEQPITNCYQLFLDIRNQIAKRRSILFPVQPKPPQGFKDYLMNRCSYVLAGKAPVTPSVIYPQSLPSQMMDLFAEQETERHRLRMQHVIEKEKLVLSVEQEILRVHGRAARALANQSLPFSVCTILRDEEVYNLITPEQEEKDRNARSRYNGRLFLSWLQDVDDKWEKIKEHMLLRHHNEAESLHAVQKMDWEWKMKELNFCDRKTTPKIDETHVPMVHVSDDFDLLPT